MGRLIDADKLLETLQDLEPHCDNKDYERGMFSTMNYYMPRIINDEPTAYDVDKVVEELKEVMQDLSVIEIFSHIDFDSTIQSGLDNFLKAYNSELLRIVMQGGVSDDVCEREKVSSGYVGYPAYYSKCCTTNSNGLEMQSYIIADWKYCPYCGKKIKMVERTRLTNEICISFLHGSGWLCNHDKEITISERNKAIDDFVQKVKEHQYILSDVINSKDYGMFTVGIEQIAEQLKAGGENEYGSGKVRRLSD